MPQLTELAHAAVKSILLLGEIAIDATAGNGHDTRFLLECVGTRGRVFTFDLQPEALTRTANLLACAKNLTLFARDHAEMRDAIPHELHGRVGAVMFNLGYLPDSDHSFTTQPASTLQAISAALELLRSGGVLTVLAYPGHPGGAEETEAVAKLLSELPEAFEVREVGSRDAEEKIPSPAATTASRQSAATSPLSVCRPVGRPTVRQTDRGEVADGAPAQSAGEGTISRPIPRLFVVHKPRAIG
jgi:hypothetical protein